MKEFTAFICLLCLILVGFIFRHNHKVDNDLISLQTQEEINTHYSNVFLTGLQDDDALQAAISSYMAALSPDDQAYGLLKRVESTYGGVSGRRCEHYSNVPECRRYYEAVRPFLFE